MSDQPTISQEIQNAIAKDDPLAPKPEGPVKVDVARWKMRDYTAFEKIRQTGDIEALNVIFARAVTAWSFAGNPKDPDAYLDLTPAEWKEVAAAVGNKIGEMFR